VADMPPAFVYWGKGVKQGGCGKQIVGKAGHIQQKAVLGGPRGIAGADFDPAQLQVTGLCGELLCGFRAGGRDNEKDVTSA